MRLVTLEPGTRLTHAGEAGDCCYWLLGGEGAQAREAASHEFMCVWPLSMPLTV